MVFNGVESRSIIKKQNRLLEWIFVRVKSRSSKEAKQTLGTELAKLKLVNQRVAFPLTLSKNINRCVEMRSRIR